MINYHVNTTWNEMTTHAHQNIGSFWNAAEIKLHVNRICFHARLKSQTGMSSFRLLCKHTLKRMHKFLKIFDIPPSQLTGNAKMTLWVIACCKLCGRTISIFLLSIIVQYLPTSPNYRIQRTFTWLKLMTEIFRTLFYSSHCCIWVGKCRFGIGLFMKASLYIFLFKRF